MEQACLISCQPSRWRLRFSLLALKLHLNIKVEILRGLRAANVVCILWRMAGGPEPSCRLVWALTLRLWAGLLPFQLLRCGRFSCLCSAHNKHQVYFWPNSHRCRLSQASLTRKNNPWNCFNFSSNVSASHTKVVWKDSGIKSWRVSFIAACLSVCAPGNGEQGKAFPLTDSDRVDQAYRENGFNIYISDRISLNRSLPDIRHAKWVPHTRQLCTFCPQNNDKMTRFDTDCFTFSELWMFFFSNVPCTGCRILCKLI